MRLQLQAAEAAGLFPDIGELMDLINGTAPPAPGRPDQPRVTPLLAMIVVTEAIKSAREHGAVAMQELPRNVPDVYFN